MTFSKPAIFVALIGAFLLGVLAVAYSSAQDGAAQSETSQSIAPKERVSTSFSDLEEEEIGEIVRAYLMENPQVIIEAVNEYSKRERLAAETRARVAATNNLDALLNPENGYVAGKNPAKAKVAVIELFDYHCSFCKRATELVQGLAERDADVKVVFRELPILRDESDYAAEISLAAREQGKFLDLHFAMMDASGILTKERIHAIAEKEGLDVAKLKAAVKDDKIPEAIYESHELAAQMGVEGTPAFIIASVDGAYVEVVNGFRPEEVLARVKEAKQAAR